ncbi:2-C-methyl-D-erythritol 2,4-cyclodiphosphate synthase [Crocinitomix algicola]|uniref:2-C-methyl-D-erythritol 2,4-cyclodiphosphate synthase n=1 Tax=Crocinitomix algicola TaxID=1740263 RepID=UPI001FDF8141|nr:2-C-methyl-D-erythritol 2,4-cyclodiphosphate synthase [Crocinitomix algicola]
MQLENSSMPNIRIGFGVDIHQLVPGRDLIIGGVKFDSEFGALGHSDADVLLHAICDAILGAANLRDIGFHFPDTDPRYKGADSKKLLKESYKLIKDKGYKVGNIDCTVLLEAPKVNPHIPAMQNVIAELLQVDIDRISIKATRGEKMGFVGNGDGIQAYASALIYV